MSTQPGSGWSQPFDGPDLPRLRQALRRQAHANGLTGDALEDFVTAVHELLGNAVRHGGGRAGGHLPPDGGTLVCAGPHGGPRPPRAPSGATPAPASPHSRGAPARPPPP